ncbi:MAG: tetratricopeptide repeat protein [Bacteroidota bacterium]
MKNINYFITLVLFMVILTNPGIIRAQEDTLSVKRLMLEGIEKMESGNEKAAIEMFDRGREMLHKIAVKKDERNINIIRSSEITRKAEKEIQKGNFEDALVLLNEAIEYNDRNIEAYKFRGSVRLVLEERIERKRNRDYSSLLNDYTNAIRITERSINDTPRNSQERKELEKEMAKILINRAFVKMQSGRRSGFNSAIDDYTLAIRYNDQNWDGFLGRAVAYNNIKDYRKEVQDYLKAIELIEKYDFRLTDEEWSKMFLNVAMAYTNLRQDMLAHEYATKSYNLGNLDAEKIMERTRP